MNLEIARPVLHPWATTSEDQDSVVVRHAQRVVVFRGPGAKALLPDLFARLDGARSIDDVLASFPEEVREAVRDATSRLVDHRLILDLSGIDLQAVTHHTLRAAAALSEALAGAVSMQEILQALHATQVQIISDLDNSTELVRLLRNSGFGNVTLLKSVAELEAVSATSQSAVVVVAPRTVTSPLIREMNIRAMTTGERWVQLLPYDGSFATVGPLFLPTVTGCYECFLLRRRSTLEFLEHQRVIDAHPANPLETPLAEWSSAGQEAVAWGVFCHLLSFEVLPIDWAPTPLTSHMVTIAWTGSSVVTERHRLFRVPRCRVCGPIDLGVPQPWFEATHSDSNNDHERASA